MRRVEQRPVMGLDHPDARAHDPRELTTSVWGDNISDLAVLTD